MDNNQQDITRVRTLQDVKIYCKFMNKLTEKNRFEN